MFTCQECGKLFPKTRRTRAFPKYCSRACMYGRNPDPRPRFWAKAKKAEGDGCWIWTATKNKQGYGSFNYNGRIESAHRVAYLLSKGSIPEGMEVCHECDNPPCVRPDHLWLGTPKENGDDRNQKGRHATKLTWDQVCEIRRRYIPRVVSMKMLADEYGVTPSAVNLLLKKRNWQERPWRIYVGK